MHFEPSTFSRLAAQAGTHVPRLQWPTELTSTNDVLSDALTDAPDQWPDYSVLGTDFQSAGHGRLGRTWTVPTTGAVTFSVPVRIPREFPRDMLGWLPLVTGWAVADTVRTQGVDAGVKWPNDVLVGNRKLCGILVRAVPTRGADGSDDLVAVIGIGINAGFTEADLPVDTATSVLLEGGDPAPEALVLGVLTRLQDVVTDLFAAGCSDPGSAIARSTAAARVRDLMLTLGSAVDVELPGGARLHGTATDLGPDASLEVHDGTHSHSVSAGDVVHARPAR
ncbi:biotin--[acetyl-CoA-carboxylase] ligase [Brevibacterium samyangense]|uniref:Biotin--[acetyl-CoA-carboxylase] ligase n=1 Tax=Brevibacterium samyangense TaxID=366888 RepID=A0ABN2TFM4_9MICO